MNDDDILEAIIVREGGEAITDDASDFGGRTRYGISERAHPEAWRNGPPSKEQAKKIYTRTYLLPFAPLVNIGIDERVREALIDDAVLSGPKTAIRSLQNVLGVPADGVIGPRTLEAALKANIEGHWLLTRLVQDRALRLARLVQQRPNQLRYLVGWLSRCLSFLG